MGYTHYFGSNVKELPQELWDNFTNDCKIVCKYLEGKTISDTVINGKPIKNSIIHLTGCYAYKYPKFGKTEILFNGSEAPAKNRFKKEGYWRDPKTKNDLSHETFHIKKNDKDGDYCKTLRKPYDAAVTACLILYKWYFEKQVYISSDGEIEEWKHGLNAVRDSLNNGKQIVNYFITDNGQSLFED